MGGKSQSLTEEVRELVTTGLEIIYEQIRLVEEREGTWGVPEGEWTHDQQDKWNAIVQGMVELLDMEEDYLHWAEERESDIP